jgi:hypothetical protein
MKSPEHIDEQKPEDQQAPSPDVKQQVPTEVEKKRPWLKPLMRVAGIVLPLVANFAGIWVVAVFMAPSAQGWSILAIFGVLLLGGVSAALFRSWWAVLVVPIAFALGGFLAFYLVPLVISPNPFDIGDAPFGVFLWEIIGPILALFGALIGTALRKNRYRW